MNILFTTTELSPIPTLEVERCDALPVLAPTIQHITPWIQHITPWHNTFSHGRASRLMALN